MGALYLNLPAQLVVLDLGPKVASFTLRLERLHEFLHEWGNLPQDVTKALLAYGLDAMDVQLNLFAACGMGTQPASKAPPPAPKGKRKT